MPTIADLSVCTPATALSKTAAAGHWQLIPYEADGLSGTMIGAGPLIGAPDVTLPLQARGWHAVHVGFWNPHHDYQGALRVKVRLDDDPCFRPMLDPEPPLAWPGRMKLKEAFFKCADLTGRSLVIGQHRKGVPDGSTTGAHKAYLAYVRLEPMDDGAVAALQADRADRSRRMLFALNDGNGVFYDGPTEVAELLEQVEQYRHSDVGAVLFAVASGDIVNYPSRLGLPWMADVDRAAMTLARQVLHDTVRDLLDRGIVPVRVLADHCHDMGIGCHAMFRMGIVGDIPPGDLWNPHHGFVRRHPELRMLDIDGTPHEKASYAFPEVRRFMLGLVEEVCTDYDVDGVNLCFVRGPHYVGYEAPVIDAFRQRHGIDPRELDENDERARRHRASYLTELVREARALVDRIGARRGRTIELSAMVYTGHAERNLFFGLDVPAWLRERLLDSIFMSLPIDEDLGAAVRAADCRLITHLMPSSRDARADIPETLEMARRGHDFGVDGFWYWDMVFRQYKPAYWQVLSRIGHRREVERMAQSPPRLREVALRSVGGFDVCHTTNRGSDERDFWPPEMLSIYSGG